MITDNGRKRSVLVLNFNSIFSLVYKSFNFLASVMSAFYEFWRIYQSRGEIEASNRGCSVVLQYITLQGKREILKEKGLT